MGYVEIYDARLRRESETRERAILALLQAKYDGSEASAAVEPVVEHELVFASTLRPCFRASTCRRSVCIVWIEPPHPQSLQFQN